MGLKACGNGTPGESDLFVPTWLKAIIVTTVLAIGGGLLGNYLMTKENNWRLGEIQEKLNKVSDEQTRRTQSHYIIGRMETDLRDHVSRSEADIQILDRRVLMLETARAKEDNKP